MTKHLLVSMFLGILLGFGGISDAEAKRFGGGGSFGGKSSFSSPFKRSTAVPVRTPSQQKAMQQNQAARQGMASRGGLMGMLGGLAIGGLLGALLFGGAFENINFMDLLVFGGMAYLLFRLLAAKPRAATPRPAYTRHSPAQGNDVHREVPTSATASSRGAGLDTRDWFRGGSQDAAGASAGLGDERDYHRAAMPQGFDERAFLNGAKIAYGDLQRAWDKRDLAEIRGLTTDRMFAEIQDRIKDVAADNRTDVLRVEAELLDAREVDAELEAVVLFDTVLREGADEQARQVREVWHFVKPTRGVQPKWYLDGIQQMEE